MSVILITGAAGFIGSHLCEWLLQEGNRVVGIDNFDPFYNRSIKEKNLQSLQTFDDFTFIEGDLTRISDYQLLPSDVDIVIHLAGKAGVRPSIADPHGYLEANITATLHLLQWMHEHQIKKLVFGSSSSVYGNQTKVPFAEDDQVDEPISPYAFSKKSCELLNYTYHSLYGLDIVNLRFFTVYGPRQRPDLAIHKFTKLMAESQAIPMYGDGTTGRDYTFVGDIVDGICKAMHYVQSHSPVFETLNLGNHHPVLLKEMIDTIAETMGVTPSLQQLPMQPGDVQQTYADISKAQKLIGYQPNTTFTDGIRQFIRWYFDNL